MRGGRQRLVNESTVLPVASCAFSGSWLPPALVMLSDQRGLVFFLPALRRLKLFIVKINN